MSTPTRNEKLYSLVIYLSLLFRKYGDTRFKQDELATSVGVLAPT